MTEVISAALGGFVGWIFVRIVSVITLRQRLISYLSVTLTLHLAGVKDNQKWLQKVMKTSIREGYPINNAPLYTPDTFSDLTCVRERCLELLTKREMICLTKCVKSLWEVEALFEGFCKSLREIQCKKSNLSGECASLIENRAERLNALIDILPKKINSIKDLPNDYAGKISAATIVPPPVK